MTKKLQIVLSLLLSLGLIASAAAEDTAGSAPAKKMTRDEFIASLHFQHGKIDLPKGIASLNLPDSFRYLPPADAERVLVDAWGNPPGTNTLGMIFPSDVGPLSANGWGVVITYDEDGHIKDDDADSIKYNDLLKEMQDATKAANEERKKAGYGEMALVGWAETPHYDKATHKFYWAKEFSNANAASSEHSLNYNIRVLGRNGVLVLNAVAGMNQIGMIKSEMPHVLDFTEFSQGNRYADFDSKTDKVAEYGLAALVAGGVAAKLGFFGKIFALLLAFKKIILIAVAGFGASIMKFFKRNKDDNT